MRLLRPHSLFAHSKGGRGAAEVLVLSVERVFDAADVVAEFSMKPAKEFLGRGRWRTRGERRGGEARVGDYG